MKATFYNKAKHEGEIEMLLSKREIGMEKAVILADFRQLDQGVYSITLYYGFSDMDILDFLLMDVKLNYKVEYNYLGTLKSDFNLKVK